MEIELTEKEREKISYLISEMLEIRNIETNPDWDDDFSKTDDFECLLLEFEKYLKLVSEYEYE